MSKVYLCSDLHLGHKNIHKFRTQFESQQEHDDYIYDVLLSPITKRDTLWVLGDVCFTKEALNKFKKLNSHGNIHIVIGNHDTDQELSISDWVNAGFTKIYSLVKKKGCWFSHCPIHPDELRGKMNVHGHTHNHRINDSRYFCVCPEQTNWRLVDFEEIKERMKNVAQ